MVLLFEILLLSHQLFGVGCQQEVVDVQLGVLVVVVKIRSFGRHLGGLELGPILGHKMRGVEALQFEGLLFRALDWTLLELWGGNEGMGASNSLPVRISELNVL